MPETLVVAVESIQSMIYDIRGQRVMVDSDLAKLYGVETKVFNQAVKRNIRRFPSDFMFQLTEDEAISLRSHSVTSEKGRGGRRYSPYVFTEQGVAMLSSVLNSEQAIRMNIEIMRAFVRTRILVASHQELFQKLKEVESRVIKHDEQLALVFDAIRQLMIPADEPKRPIGFQTEE